MPSPKTPTATEQLNADFDAAMEEFAMFKNDPKRMFCIGVTMACLTLQGYSKDSTLWPRGAADVEDAIEEYYEAARSKILNG